MFSKERLSRPAAEGLCAWKVRERMAVTNVDVATQIERTLNSGFGIGSDPDAARELKRLHDLLAKWKASPEAVGAGAAEIKAEAKKILADGVTPEQEQTFRTALGRLQTALQPPPPPASLAEE